MKMGMNKIFSLAFITLFLAGCTTVSLWSNKVWTEEEWVAVTTREFPGKTSNEVLDAAQKVLQLDDPSNISVYRKPNKLLATRRYMMYMVFAVDIGMYNFEVETEEKDGKTAVHLLISHSSSATGGAIMPGIAGGYANPQIVMTSSTLGGQIIDTESNYELFFARMESLLNGKPWIICQRCAEYIKNCNNQGSAALCSLADDNLPEGIPIAGGHIPKDYKPQGIDQISQ